MAGGFTQANHGKPGALRKMAAGDWIVFYSPKTQFENGEPLQAFTGLCQVADNAPYQAEITPDFQPWRRDAEFQEVHETPIKPLISKLEFIENKRQWGYRFRFGVIEINEHDFTITHTAMQSN